MTDTRHAASLLSEDNVIIIPVVFTAILYLLIWIAATSGAGKNMKN
jgi:hypothetical protein